MPEQGNTTDPVTADAPVATAVATRPQKAPAKNPPAQLPPYRVLLHNDDKNEMAFVIQ